MNRADFEKILPKKREHCCDSYNPCDCGADGFNQAIDECLDALVKAGVGVVPSESKLYKIISRTYMGSPKEIKIIITDIRSLWLKGEK